MEFSELVPYHAQIADKAVWLRAVSTDVFNHGPAKLFLNTGFQVEAGQASDHGSPMQPGDPSGKPPGFVVLQSGPRGPRARQHPLVERLPADELPGGPSAIRGTRSSPFGTLPAMTLRPAGVLRRRQALNEQHLGKMADPEIETRINAYEMASRMHIQRLRS